MPKYNVKIQVNYAGVIESDSEENAIQQAWLAYYGKDAPLKYESVESIEAEEIEEEEEEEEND
jgi:hypothetical protein